MGSGVKKKGLRRQGQEAKEEDMKFRVCMGGGAGNLEDGACFQFSNNSEK